jgi:phenylacetate-CoA ligase
MSQIWIPESFRDKPYARQHFADIVAWARSSHAFYKARLNEAHRHVPILDRRTAQAENDLLLNGHKPTSHTSGTTGFPVQISWSQQKSIRDREMHGVFREWMGGGLPRARLVRLRPGQTGEELLSVGEPLDKQVDFILKRRREVGLRAIVTYPSNALNLADYIQRNDIDLSFVERIVCFSEAIDHTMRQGIKQGFPRARVWSTYSSMEVGMMAMQCPFHEDYHHMNARDLGIEVLNQHDQPCQPGETGRVVVTDYLNTHSTFIRYDIGDLVVPGPCPCGRIELPALQTVLGKTRGSLKRQNGEPIMFSTISPKLRDIPGLLQYQVIQDEIDRIRFRYVPHEEADPGLIEQSAKAAVFDFLGFQPAVEFIRETHIEREPSGKFMASICHV